MHRVRVPATSANLGPGFDSFGLALSFYNEFLLSPSDEDCLVPHPDSEVDLPEKFVTHPSGNLLFLTLDRLFEAVGQKRPAFQFEVLTRLPLARGLGSSASAVVGALVLGNQYLEAPLSKEEILALATDIEGHPDNVAPALLGGCQLCDGLTTVELPWPESWQLTAVIPPKPISTEAARTVLPSQVPMTDAVFNLRKASLLTAALFKQDETLLSEALEDRLHQPYRGQLIDEWSIVQEFSAKTPEIFGSTISGSGATLLIIHDAAAYLAPLKKRLSDCQILPLRIDSIGANLFNTP